MAGEDEVEAGIDDAWEAARAAWPGVELPRAAFAAHVLARTTSLAGVHTVDLYLAAACLAGLPAALATLDRVFLSRVEAQVRRVDPGRAFADEVTQELRARLLLARDAGPTRMADYQGRGPLAAWLRVAAVRVALNLVAERKPGREVGLDEALLGAPDGWDPELEILRTRFAPLLRTAVQEAFAALSSQQRNMLRLHLVAGLTTGKIASIYRVDASTITRWLQAVRAEVRRRTHEKLTAESGVSAHELDSLAGLLLSQLDVSLASLLAETHA